MPTILAPHYGERAAMQLEYQLAKVEFYTEIDGDYSGVSPIHPTLSSGDEQFRLSGAEVFMAQHLERQLETQQTGSTLICLDVGGGFGLTAERLAAYFRSAISDSQMAVAVTNLAPIGNFSPKSSLKHELLMLKEYNGNSVQQLHTVFSNLTAQSINLTNGESLPLEGNVTLLHDRFSLTSWSQVPETDIRQIGQLLSKRGGIYMVPYDNTVKPQIIGNHPYWNDQIEGIKLAHIALQREFGLTMIDDNIPELHSSTDYVLFRSAEN